ncbi:hypothetical protein K1719_034600 [Acacia pycnantha]|nr:hypothetical protein K1719_034600 [Acacia pycnantha]
MRTLIVSVIPSVTPSSLFTAIPASYLALPILHFCGLWTGNSQFEHSIEAACLPCSISEEPLADLQLFRGINSDTRAFIMEWVLEYS